MCLNPSWLIPDDSGAYRYSKTPPLGRRFCVDEESGETLESFPVGCGKCHECLNNHKRQWIFRLMLEASCWPQNSFLTLTYADAPKTGVERREVQAFMKTLRRHLNGSKVRFYACGEYGSKGKRPHYHIIIFNYGFPDKVPFRKDKKGNLMYRSKFLESIWTKGFSSILPVNEMTLNYVTKDMQKLLPLSDGRNPPFTLMSLKPGIGIGGWSKNLTDGKIWLSGASCSIPRYFIKKAKEEGLDLLPYYKLVSNIPQRELTEDRFEANKRRELFLKSYLTK